MSEEVGLALLVLLGVGWVLYKAAEAISVSLRQASEQFDVRKQSRRTKRFERKRALQSPHVKYSVPDQLRLAQKQLQSLESDFLKHREASTWLPERPRWDVLTFRCHQSSEPHAATRQFNISDIASILRPDIETWSRKEERILSRNCSYPATLKLIQQRKLREFIPFQISLELATFEADTSNIKERDVPSFWEIELHAVRTYNEQRNALLEKYGTICEQISKWNREEQDRSTKYIETCESLRRQEVAKFQAHSDAFESECCREKAELSAMLHGFRRGVKDHVIRRVDLILASISLPNSVPTFREVDYDEKENILIVEIALPDVVHNPPTKTVLLKSGVVEKPLNQTERKDLIPQIHPAIMLRTAYELSRHEHCDAIKLLALNGWVDFINPQTGLDTWAYTSSLLVSPQQLRAISLEGVDPLAAFNALKGKSAGKLIDIIPIEPTLNLKKADSRFVDGRGILDGLEGTTNLAAMDCQDFEHLIRELFERQFANRGAEVKITQASRDRGVDAIVFDPDPIQGGKYVIQAKRYTKTVDVSAVRDLCAVVRKEGASRGILVTTSTFGSDAYDFANNEPVTLLNGSELLGLLQKNGYTFRIDLAEARRLQSGNPEPTGPSELTGGTLVN